MVHTLDRLGFTYKKTTIVPGKANPEKQKEFIENYKQLKEEKAPGDIVKQIRFSKNLHTPGPSF